MSKMDKKPTRGEFTRTQSLRLPTPPPDPTQPPEEAKPPESALRAAIDKDNEFFEYLNSLPASTKGQLAEKPPLQRAGSVFASAMAAEDAFDHLDKLYKLMEQLLNLREQNAKLQRRVRDLEHLRNLQNMDHQVTTSVLRGEEGEVPELDDDSILAEALLDNMFTSGHKRNTKHKSPSQFRIRQSILRPPRDRSYSVAFDCSADDRSVQIHLPRNCSGKSLPEHGILRKPSKVSKWTKVKAAFKWEKASPTVTGAKSQDSGIGGMLPVNNEVARYLRVPSTCENPTEAGTSPADSVLSGSWQGVHGLSTPGSLSPASSTEELNPSTLSDHRSVSRTESAGNSNVSGVQFRASKTSDEEEGDRRSRSLDYTGSYMCENSNHVSKDDLMKLHTNKSHKTPWGKVKDIIQTRKDSLKKKQHRLSARSDDCRTDCSIGSDQEDVFEPSPPVGMSNSNSGHEDTSTPTVTVTTSDEISSVQGRDKHQSTTVTNGESSRIPPEVLARYQQVVAEEHKNQVKMNSNSPRAQRRISKWTKVKKAFLTSASLSRNDDESKSCPSSPTNQHSHFFTEIPAAEWKHHEANNKVIYSIKAEDDLQSRKLKEEIHKNYEELQKKLSLEFQEKLLEWEKVKTATGTAPGGSLGNTQTGGTSSISNEDQRDPEFMRKMEEWERIKHQNLDVNRRRNIQMTNEENLPADFKKKLQEWQKIKKFGGKEDESRKKKSEWQLWRSNSSNKQDSLAQPEGRQYSEDFLKKLDEWKQIKASHSNEDHEHRKSVKENKPLSPGLARKSSSNKLIRQNKKHKMQEWLEKELQKIEREKQRLEREREKFLEREERLAKLRRSMGNGSHKKDVLVQTSTGFYRFEGISRKFTQKLYEWEKARGIGPEDSTFALLSSAYNQIFPYPTRNANGNSYRHEQLRMPKLTRSKSMDSVANLTCGAPIITHQPSSLSLNDVDELQMQCLTASPSERNLHESEDILDFGEPEAVIVEVEDFVEETAAPLENISESHQTPIYQTEVTKLCESEKCEAPQVRRSESARALSNYTLIQESLNILNKMRDTEGTCKATEAKINEAAINNQENGKQAELLKSTGAIPKRRKNENMTEKNSTSLQESLNIYYAQQSEMSQGLASKILLLQDANVAATKNVTSENSGYTISQLSDTLNVTQDISAELVTITEKLKAVLSERRSEFSSASKEITRVGTNNKYGQDICEMVDLLILKIKELKRSLSYLCAASDMTAPGRRKKGSYKERKFSLHKRASLDQIQVPGSEKATVLDNTSDEEDHKNDKKFPRRKEKLVKSKSEDNQIINYAKLQVTSFGDHRKERTERCYQLNRPVTSLSQNHLNCHFDKKSDCQNVETKDFRRRVQSVNITGENSEKESSVEVYRKNRNQRKLLRSRRISGSCSDTTKEFEDKSEGAKGTKLPATNSVIIPTSTQYLDATCTNVNVNESMSSSPVSVFVHTTRKVFTPFMSEVFDQKSDKQRNERTSPIKQTENENKRNGVAMRSHSPYESPLLSRRKQTISPDNSVETINPVDESVSEAKENCGPDHQSSRPSTPSYLPPLPNSPILQRRERHLTKETSPAIRLMIARYNQKLSEQESPGNKSAGSSGSASPIAWRSPVFERRVKAQMEKYQEEVNKSLQGTSSRYSPLFMRHQVQKSASIGILNAVQKQITSPEITPRGISLDSPDNTSPKMIRGILKSTSVGSMKTDQDSSLEPSKESKTQSNDPSIHLSQKASLKLSIPPPKPTSFRGPTIPEDRATKLAKAKEEFLLQHSITPAEEPLSAPSVFTTNQESPVKYPTRNRLSQVSVGSESSYDDMKCSGFLIKSASAGMINVDEVTYQQFRPEIHSQGYVSLPRATKKKDGKFGISSLASKFRRVKMRRNKDPAQMNTISTLCRQSLVVDITATSQEAISDEMEKNKKRNQQEQSAVDIHSPSTSKTSWILNPAKIFKPK